MLLFMFMYMLSFMLILSVDDWILIWLGLELNMLSYVILIYKRYDMGTLESCLKYFVIQSVGSALFLSSFYLINVMSTMMIVVLSYKVGAGPFYYWFPSLCSGLEWMSCYVLMTFQKVLPMFLMSGFVFWLLWFVVLISLIMGAFGSFNQGNIKQLFAYSSIHHLGWMMSCMFKHDLFWLWYLFIYSVVLIGLMMYFMMYNVNDVFLLSKWKDKLIFVMGMMSMAGLPPLLGFYLKWVAFIYILDINYVFVMFLVMMSVLMLYVYMRIVYDMLLYKSSYMTWFKSSLNLGWLIKLDYLNIMGFILGLIMSLSLLM